MPYVADGRFKAKSLAKNVTGSGIWPDGIGFVYVAAALPWFRCAYNGFGAVTLPIVPAKEPSELSARVKGWI